MKLAALFLAMLSWCISAISPIIWFGYAVYEIFMVESAFWTTIGTSIIGWVITCAITIPVGLVSYVYGSR